MTSTSNKARAYWRRRYALTFINIIIPILFLLAFQLSGASARLKGFASAAGADYYAALLIYLSVFGACFYAVTFPLGFYGGFMLEHEFSLSNQSLADWLKDEAKRAVLSSVVFLLLVEAFYFICNSLGPWWWAGASLFWIAVSLVIARVFPQLIVPLFFKYSTLSKEELRSRVLDLAGKFDIKVIDVFEIDFSKKTKKANAAVIGWGRSRRIIMADNLVNQFTTDEAVAVLAHEMAHHKLMHLWKLLLMSSASIILFFFILSRISGRFAAFFGASSVADMALFPAFYLSFAAYSLIAMPFENAFFRKLETDADRMAIQMTGARGPFISMMEKLAEKNLSDVEPGPLIEFLLYNHPSTSRRIAFARAVPLPPAKG